MAILNYFWLFLVIFGYFTLGYIWLFKITFGYFSLFHLRLFSIIVNVFSYSMLLVWVTRGYAIPATPKKRREDPKKMKKEKKKKNTSLHSPARAGPPSDLFRSRNKTVGQETKPLFVSIKKQNRSKNKTMPCPATNVFGIFLPGTAHPVLP
jgi:predicted membrane protein